MARPRTPASSASLRKAMVATLERTGAARTRSVRRAFLAVPRELFVPEIVARDGLAAIYRPELALATATDSRGMAISSSSAPMIMAPMLEALHLHPGHRVLEVGAGTGYNAALLTCLVGETGRVTSVDIEASFTRRAKRALAQGGYHVRTAVGDGLEGWSLGAPYDRIMVTASSDHIPQAWRDQLVDGGLVELPLRLTTAFAPQAIVTLRREGELLRSVAVIPGSFMALRSADGADSPIDHGPALRASTGTRSPTMLAWLDGEALSKLSPAASRRTLALLLGPSRRLRTIPSASGIGLIMFLNLSGIPNLVRYSAGGRFGVAVLGPRGASIAAVTWAPGQPGRIEAWGEDRAQLHLSAQVENWERLGGPTLPDLELTVGYGTRARRRPWRTLRADGSTVAIDWATRPGRQEGRRLP
jgi:protein-L-isoaspartate(D-aspartate) O-methyltransferase